MYTKKTPLKNNINVHANAAVISPKKQGVELLDQRPETTRNQRLQRLVNNYSTQQNKQIQKKVNTTAPLKKHTLENNNVNSMGNLRTHGNSQNSTQLQNKTLQRHPVIQLSLDENGSKCKYHVKWIRKLIPEIQSRLDELNTMDDYKKSYLDKRQQTKINQIGIAINNYLTETDNEHFTTDNEYNNGSSVRLNFIENRLIGYKLDINYLWMEFVNRVPNDFMRKQVSILPEFTKKVLDKSDLADRILNFHEGINKNDIPEYIKGKIKAFKRPSLKDWMKTIDTEQSDSHIIIINAGKFGGFPMHFTNHKDNVSKLATLSDSDNTILDRLFPDTKDWKGTHTTLELFGQKDKRNPHYFKGGSLKLPSHADNGDQPTLNKQCKDMLDVNGLTVPNTKTALKNALYDTLRDVITPQIDKLKKERMSQIL